MADAVAAALADVLEFCEIRIPENLRDQLRLEAHRRGNAITLVERRAPWNPDFGPDWTSTDVARLRFDPSTSMWALDWKRADGRWYAYDRLEPTPELVKVLVEIDVDLDGVFWG